MNTTSTRTIEDRDTFNLLGEQDAVSTAHFSPCRLYRYRLLRQWDKMLPRIVWVMLNPSTADAFILDPTIRRCMGFSRAWGFGALEVVNLFAYRATDPRAMKAVETPIGEYNDAAIKSACEGAGRVMAAWGVHGKHRERERSVRAFLPLVHVLGFTKEGYPVHPLYIPADRQPEAWSAQ